MLESPSIIDKNMPLEVSHHDHISGKILLTTNKFEGKMFSWVQLTRKDITQRINFTTKSEQRYYQRYIVTTFTTMRFLTQLL